MNKRHFGFDPRGYTLCGVRLGGKQLWTSERTSVTCVKCQRKQARAHDAPRDISTITEYGLTQKLSNSIRCF